MRPTVWVLLLVAAGVARADRVVFVHANGRVALKPDSRAFGATVLGKGHEPAVSPDGAHVLYWGNGSAGGPIDDSAPLMWVDVGGAPAHEWRPGNLRSPEFSPDGKQVIFGEMSGGHWSVMIAPATPEAHPRLLFRAAKDSVFHASWQPDGKGIVTADLDTLFFVGLDGVVQRQLALSELTGGASISSSDRFRLSPIAANRVLYSAEVEASPAMERKLHGEGQSSALFVYDLIGKERVRLTGPEVFAVDPAWSRDGATIYFRGFRIAGKSGAAIPDGVQRMDADGKNLARVAAGGEPGT